MLSHVEGTCYHQIQPRTDVLWCLCYKPILIQTVCRSHRSHCALFVSTFSCDWILIWQALCQDCADAIELEWGQAPAISGINTVIMSAARFKRRFALTMHALQPKPKWYFVRNYAAWVRKAIFVSISIWGLCISSRDKSPSASNIKCIGARQSHLGPRNERYRGGRYPDLQIQLCSWITWEPLQFVHDCTNRSSKSFSLPVVSSSCR